MHRNVLIVGATSAIALETARTYARKGAALVVTARTAERLETIKQDLISHGAKRVEGFCFSSSDIRTSNPITTAASLLPDIDAVLVAYGSLSDTVECMNDAQHAMQEIDNNATSIIGLCTMAAEYMQKRPTSSSPACIAVISSVAGDRGRQSNFYYGTAKAALNVFLQGLRNRLHDQGIRVLTIKPGFVDTPMTAATPKNALFASSHRVGVAIYKAMESGKDVVYIPWFWRYIMFIVRIIP